MEDFTKLNQTGRLMLAKVEINDVTDELIVLVQASDRARAERDAIAAPYDQAIQLAEARVSEARNRFHDALARLTAAGRP